MTDLADQAQRAALERGMRFRQMPNAPHLAIIACPKCDWLKGSPPVIEQYAAEPFGCAFCGGTT